MIIINAEQGSPGWHAARAGRVTASEFSAVLAKGEGKTRGKYMLKVIAERLTGKPSDSYHNAHMDRGTEQEPDARASYEAITGWLVDQVGFIADDRLMTGCSPDGLVGEDGIIEIKCVIPTVQVATILSCQSPPEHRAQIQGEMWLTGRKWVDFVSYSPDMPERMRTYIFRVTRDPAYIATLDLEVKQFLAEVEAYVQKIGRLTAFDQSSPEDLLPALAASIAAHR